MDQLSRAEHAHIMDALPLEVVKRGQDNETLFGQPSSSEKDEMLRRNNDANHEIEALQR